MNWEIIELKLEVSMLQQQSDKHVGKLGGNDVSRFVTIIKELINLEEDTEMHGISVSSAKCKAKATNSDNYIGPYTYLYFNRGFVADKKFQAGRSMSESSSFSLDNGYILIDLKTNNEITQNEESDIGKKLISLLNRILFLSNKKLGYEEILDYNFNINYKTFFHFDVNLKQQTIIQSKIQRPITFWV